MRRFASGGRALVAPLFAALVVVAFACDDDDPDPDEAREEPVLEIDTNTPDPVCMKVEEDLPAEVETLPVIACDVPHTHEIYATIDYDAADVFPGVDALGDFAQLTCLEAFEPYVGASVFDSSYSYTWLVPTLGSWNDDDDRAVLCVLLPRDGSEVVGSAKGTNA
ncbi:MAG: septum formation family protein [Ilumatobacteraceae bacterium]